MPIKIALVLLFVMVEGADAWTTNIILCHGGGESNPIMAYAQTSLGNLWVIPKMGFAAVVALLLNRSRKPLHIAAVIAFCASAVVNNLLVISEMH